MTVIAFRPRTTRPGPRPDRPQAGPADILFFTGVRYEKLETPARPLKTRGTGTGTGKPRRSRTAS